MYGVGSKSTEGSHQAHPMLLAQVVLSLSRAQGDGTARTNPRKRKKRILRKTIAFPGSIEPAFPGSIERGDETRFGFTLGNIVPATHTSILCTHF